MTSKFSWTPVFQAVAVIITLITLALAGERRIVIVEQRQVALQEAVVELKAISSTLSERSLLVNELVAKQTVLIERLCQEVDRHANSR